MSDAIEGAPYPAAVDPEREVAVAVYKLTSAAGMSKRETMADPARVPQALVAAIEKAGSLPSLVALRNGEVPRFGFGLAGVAGVGKSFCIAAALRSGTRAQFERYKITRPWFRWCSWPDVVSNARTEASRDHGLPQAAAQFQSLSWSPMLVIDDLGAERARPGTYEDDWATSQLDLVVNARHGALLPTFYTTNLTRNDFLARYGARMFSRLCGENTFIVAPSRGDMRARS